MAGHGEKLNRRQDLAIAALLSEPTVEAAARKARVSYSALKGWLQQGAFRAAYRAACRGVLERTVARLQAATGTAVDTLVAVARDGEKDSDRVRAAVAVLEHAVRGVELADVLRGDRPDDEADQRTIEGTGDVVKLLAERLRQVDAAELPTGERSRLTATLADALLRAIGVDVLDKRLEALQAVLVGRKEAVR